MLNEEKVKTNPVSCLQYNLVLSPFFCHGEDEIWNIYPNITGNTGLTIHANYLPILNGQVLNEEGMTIFCIGVELSRANARWSLNFRRAIEENLPIGDLLEMIDK
jgi:hypothetical protein